MKRLVLFLLLAVGSLSSQSPPELTAFISPFGIWPVCEANPRIDSTLCEGFQSGHELYIMAIRTPNAATRAYLYSVGGTLVSGKDAKSTCMAGSLPSGDEQCLTVRTGTNTAVTSVLLDFGGVLQSTYQRGENPVEVRLEELAITGGRTGQYSVEGFRR